MSDCPSLPSPFIRGAVAYRDRAQRLRAMADDFAGREWRDILLRLAKSYEEHANSTDQDVHCAS